MLRYSIANCVSRLPVASFSTGIVAPCTTVMVLPTEMPTSVTTFTTVRFASEEPPIEETPAKVVMETPKVRKSKRKVQSLSVSITPSAPPEIGRSSTCSIFLATLLKALGEEFRCSMWEFWMSRCEPKRTSLFFAKATAPLPKVKLL